MNISTITITKEEAEKKLEIYKKDLPKNKLREDEFMKNLYQLLKEGAKILDINKVFKQTGLKTSGKPKLAIARADWKHVWFHPNYHRYYYNNVKHAFSDDQWIQDNHKIKNIFLPDETFNREKLLNKKLKSPVPYIPPDVRPVKSLLKNYHILFEVKTWKEYPRDPFLLKRINNSHLFRIEAEWDLTPLEASLLASL